MMRLSDSRKEWEVEPLKEDLQPTPIFNTRYAFLNIARNISKVSSTSLLPNFLLNHDHNTSKKKRSESSQKL